MYSFHAVGAGERRFWLFSQVQNKWCHNTLLPSTGALVFHSFQVTPYLLWPSLSVSFYCSFFFSSWRIIGVKSDLNDSSKATKWMCSLRRTKHEDTDPRLCPSQMAEVLLLSLWSTSVAHFGPVHAHMHVSKILHSPVCSQNYIMYKIILLTAGTLPLSSG